MSTRTGGPLVAVALALLALLVAPARHAAASPDAAGTISIGLVDVPVELADDPRARIAIVDHLSPGDRIERRIRVTNGTAEAMDLDLYAAASGVVDGAWAPAEGRTTNELTSWIDVHPTTVAVPAGGTATARVTIDVPEDAVDGERYAVIWAQTPGVDAGGVTHVSRVGVRAYLSVGDGALPATDFGIRSLQAARDADGRPVVEAMVESLGPRALDLVSRLELEDTETTVIAGPFGPVQPTTLAPGTTSAIRFVLPPGLAPGPWQATMVSAAGVEERTHRATLTFPEAAAHAPDAPAADDPTPVDVLPRDANADPTRSSGTAEPDTPVGTPADPTEPAESAAAVPAPAGDGTEPMTILLAVAAMALIVGVSSAGAVQLAQRRR